jgi:hypothetical protein
LKIDNPEIVSLQRNKLLDPERNGFEATIGITKSINNSWNFRGGISFLKMRQWAEYKINTDKYLVKTTIKAQLSKSLKIKLKVKIWRCLGSMQTYNDCCAFLDEIAIFCLQVLI